MRKEIAAVFALWIMFFTPLQSKDFDNDESNFFDMHSRFEKDISKEKIIELKIEFKNYLITAKKELNKKFSKEELAIAKQVNEAKKTLYGQIKKKFTHKELQALKHAQLHSKRHDKF